MIGLLLPLLSNWRGIALGVALLAVVGFGVSWHMRGRTIDSLRTENAALVADLKVAGTLLDQARSAGARLGQRLQEREVAKGNTGRLMEGIARAAPDQDGAVAPVLRDALDGLRRLRKPDGDAARAP